MATVVKLTSGLLAHRLNSNEQNMIWNEVNKNVSPVGQHPIFTPQDNIEYYIASEKELKENYFEAIILTSGKTIKVKYNIYNQDQKINSAVRNANK